MGKYGPKPIHDIPKYRRLGRNAGLLLILVGVGLAFEARGGAVDLWLWLVVIGMVAVGAGLGLWNATAIVRRADEVYSPGTGAYVAALLGAGVVAAAIGVVRATVEEGHQVFYLLAGAAALLAYLATMGTTTASRLRSITSGEHEWPWPSHLDEKG